MRTPSAPAAPPASLPSLRECTIRASVLLKALRSGDVPRALAAAERLRVLPHFTRLTPERIAAWGRDIRRKHALAAVAAELGFTSWTELRHACVNDKPRAPDIGSLFDRTSTAVYLNYWCRTYEEAVVAQASSRGYLFPYRSQFVVAPAGVLEAYGIDALDPDWERIGRNWVRPRDQRAFERLCRKVSAAGV